MALDMVNIKSTLSGSGITFKKMLRGSDNKEVWSAGAIVTYVLDTFNGAVTSYTEDVDNGASCLAPTTFDPQDFADSTWSGNGWVFVGWREDTRASSNVLSSKIMGTEPITLYAVFKQTITVGYTDNNGRNTTSDTRYYNNGNFVNPSFTLYQQGASGWTSRGWSTSNQGDASITYLNGATFERNKSVELYALYQKNVRLTTVVNGTSSYVDKTMYWAPAGEVIPTFAVSNPTISGATFKGWSVTAGNATVSYSSLASGIKLSSNLTVYAVVTYSNVTLKSGSTSYSRDSGTDLNVITGIDGSKYSSLSIGVGDAWVETGRWATVCSARAILRVKTSNGTTYTDTILHEMCWEEGYWSGEPYEAGTPIRNTTVTMNLYPDNVGQMLAVIFDGDAVGGNVYVNTVTAIGKTVVG